MKISKKQVFITLAAIFIIALVIWGFWPSPVLVSEEQVTVAPLEVTIEEEGKTRVIDRYTISAPVTGYLLRLRPDVGDTVKAGQQLFTIQPIPDLLSSRQSEIAEAQLEAAKARLKQAQENLNLAREEKKLAYAELTRMSNLFEADIGSEQGLENVTIAARRAQANLASSEFAVNIAEHEVHAARSALTSYQGSNRKEQIAIESPVNGRLLKIHQRSEGTVQAGMPIIDIGDPKSLEIQVDLLSTDAVQVQQGTPVRIKRWGLDDTLNGAVKYIEPAGFTRISALGVEEQRVPVIVDFVTPYIKWNMLGDAYRIVAEFIIWQSDSVMQVPSSALFRTGDDWGIFVIENSRAKLRMVEIGRQSGLNTQIITGIGKGDHVITHPDERIDEGVRVESRN